MHVALIIDGNGRWGMKHCGVRTMGYEEGARNALKLLEQLPSEIKYLTLYGLSVDNIRKRPKEEVETLYNVFRTVFPLWLRTAQDLGIKLNFLGNHDLPEDLLGLVFGAVQKTACNNGLVLSIALSYGSRNEIVRAVRLILRDSPDSITEESFSKYLDTRGLPDVDLIIRTGGERRLSDFLLWQVAYAEFFFTDTLWPDFDSIELSQILSEYHKRERRFGGLNNES